MNIWRNCSTSFEGTEKEPLRRWSKLSLREILLAQEEMHKLANHFHPGHRRTAPLRK